MKNLIKPLKPHFRNRAAMAALAVKIVYSFDGEQRNTRFVILPVEEIKHYASGKSDKNTTYLKSSLDHYVTVRLSLDEFWEKMVRPDQNGLVDLTAFTGPEGFLATYHQTSPAESADRKLAESAGQSVAESADQKGSEFSVERRVGVAVERRVDISGVASRQTMHHTR